MEGEKWQKDEDGGRERRMKLIRGETSSSRLFFHVEQRGD